MRTIEFKEEGWTAIPGDTKMIIAFFKDGHKEPFTLFEFISLKKREKKSIVKLDCLTESDMKV